MSEIKPTNAASSGVYIDKKILKGLMKRSDGPGFVYLGIWAAFLLGSGLLLWISFDFGIGAILPAMILYGSILTMPAYSLSHECAHGTAFRRRWLNEAVLWVTSLIYFEGPTFRRYAHARHHTYTWMRAMDAQMPFNTPLTPKSWLLELSDLGQYVYDARHMLRNAFGSIAPEVRDFTPQGEWPKLKWESRIFLAFYLGGATASVATASLWPLFYLVFPRLLGGVTMQLFTIIQHAEMEENSPDIRKSTRSFTTNWFGRFLYANMAYHIEHHLYPTVPFHALADLNGALRDQLPKPSRGLWRTNLEVARTVFNRAFRHTSVPRQETAQHG